MTLAAKVTKDVTACTFDGYCDGNRFLGMTVRRPRKGAEEKQFLSFCGNQLVINREILNEYGIELTVNS